MSVAHSDFGVSAELAVKDQVLALTAQSRRGVTACARVGGRPFGNEQMMQTARGNNKSHRSKSVKFQLERWGKHDRRPDKQPAIDSVSLAVVTIHSSMTRSARCSASASDLLEKGD